MYKRILYLLVATRLSTFLANQLLLRLVTPADISLASQLEFVINVTCFMSSEAVRLAVLRMPRELLPKYVANISWASILLSIPASFLAFFLASVPEIRSVRILLVLTLAIQALSEPLVNQATHRGANDLRPKFEAAGVAVACAVTVCAVICAKRTQTISTGTAFAVARLCSAVTTAALYLRSRPQNEPYMYCQESHKPSWTYFKLVFVQMVFKNVLTEGDRIVFTRVCTPAQQGLYSVVNNYGGLVARMVLNPIEEGFKIELLKGARKSALFPILKGYTLLSVAVLVFGVPNAGIAGEIFFGRVLRVPWYWEYADEVGPLLAAYVVYIPFLALNGVIEAFFQACASEKWIHRYSGYLLVCLGIFFSASMVLVPKFGLAGLVGANILNMALRIGFCLFAVCGDLKGAQLADLVQDPSLFTGISIFFLVLELSRGFSKSILDLFISGVFGGVWAGVVGWSELIRSRKLRALETTNRDSKKSESSQKEYKEKKE